MPHFVPLNTDRDTVKRLLLDDDGRAALQHFTRTGRVEIRLTAEELEIVRTSCLIPDCDCVTDEERWDLAPLPSTDGLPQYGYADHLPEDDTYGQG